MMLNGHPLLTGVFLVLLAWMCLATLLRACTLPRGVARGGSCGKCGYTYSGWTRCPECGGEIADVGVATPRLAVRFRGGWLGIILGLLFAGFALTYVLRSSLNMLCRAQGWNNNQRQVMYSPAKEDSPPYGMMILWDLIGSPSKPPSGGRIVIALDGSAIFTFLAMGLMPTSGNVHAEIRAGSGRYTIRDSKGAIVREGTSFGQSEAELMLELAAVPIEAEDRAMLAAQIVAETDLTRQTSLAGIAAPPNRIMYGGSSGGQGNVSLPFTVFGLWGPQAINTLAASTSALVVLLAGSLIVSRRRRMLRTPTLTSGSSTSGASHP